MPNYPLIQMGCVSRKRATRVTARCCPAPTGSQCQGREGVAEIGAWNYDAHTPNFPSLSEVRDRSYGAAPFLLFLSEGPSARRRVRAPSPPPVEAYVAASPRCPVLLSPHPLPLPHNHFSLRLYTSGYTRMAASLAPSNQKPIICLRESLRLVFSVTSISTAEQI